MKEQFCFLLFDVNIGMNNGCIFVVNDTPNTNFLSFIAFFDRI
mgnify:CR=1 FL=1